MVNFFAKFFIKDYKDIDNPSVQLNYISLSGIIGLILNLLLFATKLIAGLISGSVALFSDAFNNLSDSLTSLLAIFGSTFSKRPADKEHPYGHGRYEYIASFLVSMVIMYVGYSLFRNALEEFRVPSEVEFGILPITILIISILVKIEMYKYNHDLYVRFDSSLNDGVARDSINDVLATSAILVCGFLDKFVNLNLDALAGLVISVFVFKTGFDFAKDTISLLTGEEVSEEVKEKIGEIVLSLDYIRDYHDLNVHDYGRGRVLATLHAETPYDLSILSVHDEIDRIEKEVKRELSIDLVIHMDPTYSYYDDKGIDFTTEVLKIDSANDIKQIMKPVEILKRGGLVVIPTETVYGLAADYKNESAIRKIFEVKRRPLDNPLIVHIAEISDIYELADDIPEDFEEIVKNFWPGPLTAVLKKKSSVPDIVTAGGDTVAIRMPDNDITRKIISLAGPLAAPSANLSSRPSPTNPTDVLMDLDKEVEMVVDGGSSRVGIESTVVDFTEDHPVILRPGFYTDKDLLKYYDEVTFDLSLKDKSKTPKSPGQKYKHYAPKADMQIYDFSLENRLEKMKEDLEAYKKEGKKVGVLTFDEYIDEFDTPYKHSLGSINNMEENSRNLFAKLRDFDRDGVDIILAEGIEEKDLGFSIMNRMKKSAAGHIIK